MFNFQGWSRRQALPLLVLALAAGCDEEVTPPFEVEGTGGLEGQVFFDANGDGIFDPSAGDSALAGVQVVLLDRGTDRMISGGQAVTDDQGRFVLDAVPVGTHDLLIDEATAPEALAFCRNPLPVTIFLGETGFSDLAAESSCLVSIAEAEAEPLGSFVTVSGIVTSAPGMIRGGYTHIQDATGGIRIFASSLEGQGIEVGDRIEVSGTLAQFGGDLQLTSVTLNEHQEDVADPQPELVTTAEIAAAGLDSQSELLGSFVRVEAAELVTEFGAGGLNIRNAWIDTGDGRAQIRLESALGSEDEVTSLMAVGKCYDIVGVLGAFNQAGQLFPRQVADIEEVPCP